MVVTQSIRQREIRTAVHFSIFQMPIPLGIFIYVQSTEVLLLNRIENIEPPIGTASVTMRLPGVPPPNFEEWEGNAEFAIHHDPGIDLPIASATPNPPGLPPILEEWGGEYQYVYENAVSSVVLPYIIYITNI